MGDRARVVGAGFTDQRLTLEKPKSPAFAGDFVVSCITLSNITDVLQGQPGQSERPLQAPRVKLAFSFSEPAAISSASSETLLMKSSCSLRSRMVFVVMALVLCSLVLLVQLSRSLSVLAAPDSSECFSPRIGFA